jgi:hypothetical protein
VTPDVVVKVGGSLFDLPDLGSPHREMGEAVSAAACAHAVSVLQSAAADMIDAAMLQPQRLATSPIARCSSCYNHLSFRTRTSAINN